MKKLTILLLMFTYGSLANNARIDSLKLELTKVEGPAQVTLLNKISASYLRVNPDTSLFYAQKAYTLAETGALDDAFIVACNRMAAAYYYKGDYEQAVSYQHKALEVSKQMGDQQGIADAYNKLGAVYGYLGEYELSIDYALKASDIFKVIGDTIGLAGGIQSIGNARYNQGDFKEALRNFKRSHKLYSSAGDSFRATSLNNNIGLVYWNTGQYDSAVGYYMIAKEAYEAADDKVGVSTAYNNIGIIYLETGKYDLAEEYFQRSLETKEAMGAKQGMANTLSNIGIVKRNKGEYEQAIDYYLKALKIREQIGDQAGVAKEYLHVGDVFQMMNKDDQALKRYRQAMELYGSLGDQKGLADSYNYIGSVFENQQEYDEAIDYLLKSLTLKEAIGDKKGFAQAHYSIGKLYNTIGRSKKAMTHLRESQKHFLALDDRQDLLGVYLEIGALHYAQQQYGKADKNLQASIAIAREIGARHPLSEGYKLLARVNKQQKDYQSALDFHERYALLKDSLLNEENNKQIVEMEAKYENEKKEKEISLLSKENEIQELVIEKQRYTNYAMLGGGILVLLLMAALYNRHHLKQKAKFRQQQADLKIQLASLEKKALQSQMKPHFIFNCMASIQVLMTDGKTEQATMYLGRFASLLRQVLENANHNTIALAQELENLDLYVQLEQLRMANSFDYEIEVKDDVDLDYVEIPPLLIQPYVENAIWHGIAHKKNEGKIKIEISANDPEEYVCCITDNGIGREQAKIYREKKHRSMGMNISQERLKLLQPYGTSSVNIIDLYDDQKAPAGTRVEIRLSA